MKKSFEVTLQFENAGGFADPQYWDWQTLLHLPKVKVVACKELEPEAAVYTDTNGVSWRYVNGQLEHREPEDQYWRALGSAGVAQDFMEIAKLISNSQEHSVKQPFTVKYRTGLTVKELGRVLGVPSSVILKLLKKHVGVQLREDFTLTLSEFKTLGKLLRFGVEVSERVAERECPW